MKAFAAKYPQFASAIHTFLAAFIVTIVGAIALIPADSILSSKTWTTAVIASIVMTALRAGVKAVSPLAIQ